MQLHMGSPHCPGECRNQIKNVFISNKSFKTFMYLLVFFSSAFTPMLPLFEAEPKFLVWCFPLNGWKCENEICKCLLESQVRPEIGQQDTSKKLKTALKMNPNPLVNLQGQWVVLGGWFGLKRFLRLQSWKMENHSWLLPPSWKCERYTFNLFRSRRLGWGCPCTPFTCTEVTAWGTFSSWAGDTEKSWATSWLPAPPENSCCC